MPATLTLTGDIGPGDAIAAVVFSNVTMFQVEVAKNLIAFTQSGTQQTIYVDIADATTVTATKSGTTWTLVIS